MSTLWSLLSAVLVAVFAGQLAAGLDKHGGARETSFAIEDVVIGGELQAKALVNTVTGICVRIRSCVYACVLVRYPVDCIYEDWTFSPGMRPSHA